MVCKLSLLFFKFWTRLKPATVDRQWERNPKIDKYVNNHRRELHILLAYLREANVSAYKSIVADSNPAKNKNVKYQLATEV